MEIEKKYRVLQLPKQLEQYPCNVIEQAYLCARPTVRIRKSNNTYFLTLKDKQGVEEFLAEERKEPPIVGSSEASSSHSTGIINREIEIPLSQEAFEHLKEKKDGYLIEKRRYLIPLSDGLTAELDVFGGRLTGLYFVEVEFPDVTAAREFQPPDWMGEEVSDDRRYRNSELSQLERYDADFFA